MSGAISPLFALSSQGGGSTPVLQTKSVTISDNGTVVITPDTGYDGLEQVNVTVNTRFKAVGGKIFYIDSTSTKTYKFYDSNMDEIQNVAVGDAPAFYEVVDEGNGKEKYYIYYDEKYVNKTWTYKSGNDIVFEEVGVSSTSIGTGKTNTATVMAKDSGAYITTLGSYDTVWKLVKECRDSKLGNCDDWYVGSKDEMVELRTFMVNNSGTVTNFFTGASYMWTSSEYSDEKARTWYAGSWSEKSKSYDQGVVLVRSF